MFDDGKWIFEKCINKDKPPRKIRLPTSLVLKDIFSENKLKEYLMMLKKMCKPRGVAGALHINKGQNLIIERRVSAEKMRKKTKEYQYFVLKDIFSEGNLKKCINGIKNILTKNEECDKGLVKPLHGRGDMVLCT